MCYGYERILLKEHTSTEHVLEDFYEVINSDFYINEADGDPLPVDMQGGEMQAPPSDQPQIPGEEMDLAHSDGRSFYGLVFFWI